MVLVVAAGCSSNGSSGARGGAGAGAGSSGSAGASGAAGAAGAAAGVSGGAAGGSGQAGSDTGVAGATGTAGTQSTGASGSTGAAGAPPDGGAAGAPPAGGDGGALAPVQFYGRWDFTKPGVAVTVNSGAYVAARFLGTGITATLDLSHSQAPVTTVEWQIDGGPWTETDVKATMTLAMGLPAGMHDVVFMARGMEELFNRWNPPVVASLNFIGFQALGDAATLVPTPRPSRLKIEFIGDSITEGVRVYMNDASDPWHTNGRLAYPCLVSQALGAEWNQVGFGHQGLLQAGHGNVPVAADSFDWVYGTVPRDKSWVADVVVLNQGTNDRDATSTAFTPAFGKYLDVIRAGYPNALFFVLRPFGGYREADIAAVTAAKIAAGDKKMFYVDTTGWLDPTADYTEGLHPNVMGHQKATAALLPVLRAHLPP
jgi:lysophospholipase L1-like esterase